MNTNDYVRLAMRTNADQEKIRQRMFDLGPTAAQLDNAVRGLTDEVGEVASVVKKWIEYGQPLNVTKLNEELGDCCWRIVQACDAVGLTLSDVLRANIEKLRVRYPDKYSDHRAADENRDREREAEAIHKGERRTRSQVLKERQNAPAGGCCERFADNMGCDCLANAIPDTLEEARQSGLVQDGHGFGHKTGGGLEEFK